MRSEQLASDVVLRRRGRLQRLDVSDDVLDALCDSDVRRIQSAEYRAPHWHIGRTVRVHATRGAGDKRHDPLAREPAAVPAGQGGQVGGPALEGRGHRTVATTVAAVARRAVPVEVVAAGDRLDDQRRRVLRGLRVARRRGQPECRGTAGEDPRHRYHSTHGPDGRSTRVAWQAPHLTQVTRPHNGAR